MLSRARLRNAVALLQVDIARTNAAKGGIQQTTWFVNRALGVLQHAFLTSVDPSVYIDLVGALKL